MRRETDIVIKTPETARSDKSRVRQVRRRLYEVLEIGHGEDFASRIVDTSIVTLIVLNIATFIAETDAEIHAAYKLEFEIFEIVSVALFSIEYLMRLWTAVEVPYFKRLPAWKARFKLATRPALLIDLAAILPFYVAHFFFIDLRMLRALRLLRFLKLSRYSPAMHSLIRVLSNERKALVGAGLLLITAVLFASTGMYYLEGHVQPQHFGSVAKSCWWAIATLTTVGYGDVTPITAIGRFFGGIVMVTGLCILALPVAIISAGFSQEVNRRDFVVTWSLMSRIPMLAELDAKDVQAVMPLLHAHNMPPNVEVLADEAEDEAIYFIASGNVRHKHGENERTFTKGECFGHHAILGGENVLGSFVTTSKCRLLKLHKEDFHRLRKLSPAVAEHLKETMGGHH